MATKLLISFVFSVAVINGQGPPGYQGIGCPSFYYAPCPAGQFRVDAVQFGGRLYGCNCAAPPGVVPPPAPVPPTIPVPPQPQPQPQIPVPPQPPVTFPQPGQIPQPPQMPQTNPPQVIPKPPATFPQPGQTPQPQLNPFPFPFPRPNPGQIPIPPPSPGTLPGAPGPKAPGTATGGLPLGPATTWAPGATQAPIDELCGGAAQRIKSFRRVGNSINVEIECEGPNGFASTTTSTRMPLTSTTPMSTVTPSSTSPVSTSSMASTQSAATQI